jgi:hypothetical protein
MKTIVAFGSFIFVLTCVTPTVLAQETATLPIPVAVAPTAPAPSTPSLVPELGNLWYGDSGRSYHLTGEVGVGLFSLHGGGPAFGTSASVGVLGDRGGVGLGWQDFNQSSSKTSFWSNPRRP